jgi:hypothetical protein
MWLDQDKGSNKEKLGTPKKRAFAGERIVYMSGYNWEEEQAFDDAR